MPHEPNIVFITCDQLRNDALGCYGNRVIRTPHVDRLAEGGVRFDRTFAACPVCAPNRGSIATGRYPSINGLRCNGMVLPHTELTFMEVLRRSGYATGGVGKMHFGPQWGFPEDGGPLCDPGPELAIDPQPTPDEFPWYGFEEFLGTEDHRVGPYGEYLAQHGYDVWADPHSFTYPQHLCARSKYPQEHHQTAWVADRSVEFIERQTAERPFFLWTSFVQPHHPFVAPAPFDTMYDPSEMPLPLWDEAVVQGWPDKYRRTYYADGGGRHEAIGMCNLTDADWRRIKAHYYGMVSLIDKQVGRLVEALKRRRMLENTMILFTSDHGELLGDYHLVFKGTAYDCVTSVPLIVTLPDGRSAGQAREALCSSVDLAPTVLDLAGVDVPPGMQGVTLSRVLDDPSHRVRDAVFIERASYPTVRTENALLAWHCQGDAQGELYDLRTDPGCLRNLWGKTDATCLQREMTNRLIRSMAENVDPLQIHHGRC